MKRHGLWMVVGCAAPLLLILIFPIVGIRGNWQYFIFIVLMFACHLGMSGHHGDGHSKKEDEHEQHKR
jgi:hypothetical protein